MINILSKKSIIIFLALFSFILFTSIVHATTIDYVVLDKNITRSGASVDLDSAVTLDGNTAVNCYSYLSVDSTYSPNDTYLGDSDPNSCDGVFTLPLVNEGNYFVLARLIYQNGSNPQETTVNFASITVDNTLPVFMNLTDKTIRNNESLDYNISTYDINGISILTVNDTTNFNITSSGHLVNITELSTGKYKLNLSLADIAENANSATITITIIDNKQAYADKQNITVSNGTIEIIVDSGSPVEKITIPQDISEDTEINLSLASLLDNGNVTLINNLTLTRETSTYNYTTVIPSGAVIIGGSEWDGKIRLPTSKATSSYTAPSGNVDKSIEIGQEIELNFSKPVKVVLGGMAGKKAGWSRGNGNLNNIPSICDSAANPTNINSKITKECYIDSGEDLIIHSYHFTTFAAYTPSSSSSSSSSGSGPSGGKIRSNIVIAKEPIEEEAIETPVIEPVKEVPEVVPIIPVIQLIPVQEEQGLFDSLTGAVIGVASGKKGIVAIFVAAVTLVGVIGFYYGNIKRRERIRKQIESIKK
ncbi:hypothetical protein HY500_00275 [Candidatus Woesearchaeota archaeon]|nr:hypothetical protein [Candidatus Woesearchaeota archaeon]